MDASKNHNLFGAVAASMHERIEQVAEGVGVHQVYVEWRSSWLTKLYAPQPLHSNRIKDGELLNRVEDSMVSVRTLRSDHCTALVSVAYWLCVCHLLPLSSLTFIPA